MSREKFHPALDARFGFSYLANSIAEVKTNAASFFFLRRAVIGRIRRAMSGRNLR